MADVFVQLAFGSGERTIDRRVRLLSYPWNIVIIPRLSDLFVGVSILLSIARSVVFF